ncbi:MAG: LD-carboxypeptidase [Alphaproteobacteria bacterium]|nr:LD-carboxypeptidase [Alphaproteobacteria bacterium]
MFLKLKKKSCLTLIFFSFFASSSHGSSALEEINPSVVLFAPSHAPVVEQVRLAENVFKGHATIFSQVFEVDKECPEILETNAVWDAFCSLLGGDHPLSIVWAIRGGRMSLRFWQKLDDAVEADSTFLERLQSKIVLVGFSDITSLHLWFNAHGIPSLHGPVAAFCEETRVGCGLTRV